MSLSAVDGRSALRATLLLVGALLALRLFALVAGGLDLGPDEAQYWWWAQDLAWGYFSKPPLLAWTIAATTAVCGDAEACVRLASPLFHVGTSLVLLVLGSTLGGPRVGLLAAAAYATLPGVAVSSQLVSTDPPVLFFWAVALLALFRSIERRGAFWPLVLGTALGAGLLAKQAMLYGLLGLAVAAVLDRRVRHFVLSARMLLVLAPAALLVAPFVAWNRAAGWPTFRHTAENAALGRAGLHPLELLAFLGGQIGLLGPILAIAVIVACGILLRRGASADMRVLLAMSLPVLLLVGVQALVSRAHDNWAATAYVALVPAALLVLARRGADGLVRAALAVNLAIAAAIPLSIVVTSYWPPPGRWDVLGPLRGWRAYGQDLRSALDERGLDSLVIADRKLMAGALFYVRPLPSRIGVLDPNALPQNHFELTLPWRPQSGERALLVSHDATPAGLPAGARLEPAGTTAEPFRPGRTREVRLFVMTSP